MFGVILVCDVAVAWVGVYIVEASIQKTKLHKSVRMHQSVLLFQNFVKGTSQKKNLLLFLLLIICFNCSAI